MRRKDREMPADFAYQVSDKTEYAFLSMVTPEGEPYCVPVSIARQDQVIYFHSAKEGFKIDCLRTNPKVCLVCVGHTYRTPKDFTTEYESAIIRGTASEVTEDQEKILGLRLICLRHTPTNMDAFDEAIEKSLWRTAVWKIQIEEITGKRKKYDKAGKEMKFGRME